jgi:hypothetical protein
LETVHGMAGFPFPEWRGQELAGKRIVVFPEQGFGDSIQFARFAPQLAALGARVTLLAEPGLFRLYRDSFEAVEVIAANGPVEFPDPDYWAKICSLAYRFGVTPRTIPAAPYLKARQPPPQPAPGRRVGVMANGNPRHKRDLLRSLPEAQARVLLDLGVSLHPADTQAYDFAETAALIETLDLVISVDTSVAHLAGALGKPCWVLLPAEKPDWRWMTGRTDSPWYPSIRLYRQATPGDWRPVLDAVRRDLDALGLDTPKPGSA